MRCKRQGPGEKNSLLLPWEGVRLHVQLKSEGFPNPGPNFPESWRASLLPWLGLGGYCVREYAGIIIQLQNPLIQSQQSGRRCRIFVITRRGGGLHCSSSQPWLTKGNTPGGLGEREKKPSEAIMAVPPGAVSQLQRGEHLDFAQFANRSERSCPTSLHARLGRSHRAEERETQSTGARGSATLPSVEGTPCPARLRLLLETSREADPPTALGRLFPCSAGLAGRMLPLRSQPWCLASRTLRDREMFLLPAQKPGKGKWVPATPGLNNRWCEHAPEQLLQGCCGQGNS